MKKSSLFALKQVSHFSLLLLLITACSSNSNRKQIDYSKKSYEGPVSKGDWMFAWLPANPATLNPILSTDAYASQILNRVFDGLVTFDSKTANPVGRLAESWSVSPDGLTYEFKLRKNILFHDGKELTAKDVKFSFDRIKDPKIDAGHMQNYFKDLKSVEVLDSHNVRFTMASPYFRNLIVLGTVEIMPEHVYSEGEFNTHSANRFPIGSGPYRFEKWDQGRSIELRRNENYFGLQTEEFKDQYNFERIIYRVITEDTVAALALKKGEIDVMSPTTNQYQNEFKGEDFEKRFYRLQYTTPDGNGYGWIGWNLRSEKFKSKKIRRALAMAMPREEINQKIYQGSRQLAVGPIPVSSPKQDPSIEPIAYDLEGAKKILEAEGWKDTNADGILEKGNETFKFDILFTAQNADSERIALIYQQSLRQIGVQLEIKTLEWTVFLKTIKDGKFDAAMLAWGSSLDSDPYQIWHSSQAITGGSNIIGFKNKRVDEILEKARVTLDREKRNVLYQEFSRIIADEQPYLFLFESPLLFVASRRFQNVLPLGILGPDVDAFFTPPGWELYSGAKEN